MTRNAVIQESKLSSELCSGLKKFSKQRQLLEKQEERVRELMISEGVFDDSGRLSEVIERLPYCALKLDLFDRFLN